MGGTLEGMLLRMWTYDLAREQSPTLEHLRSFFEATRAGGYNAIGLYMEHRFAYPSSPWTHGKGCVTPEMVQTMMSEFPDIQVIPFLNVLGHMEGFLYTEEGHRLAEERFKGLQADPTNPALMELAQKLIDDVLAIFPSEIIHIGGDETSQLGKGETSRRKVEEYENEQGVDGKAKLYGGYLAPLLDRVIQAGRRPAIWGDMFFEHPSALDIIPPQTLIFDWQYFKSPRETSRLFRDRGFDVVYSPTLHTYNAAWFHLAQSEENVREHAVAAVQDGVYGVCVTTWECALFGNYETILPAIRASGRLLSSAAGEIRPEPTPGEANHLQYAEVAGAPVFLAEYAAESDAHADFARLLGIELQSCGGLFAFSGIRSSMKSRMLLYSNPFLFWLRNREDVLGEPGDRALVTLEKAISVAPDSGYRGCAEFIRLSIEFVRMTEAARVEYAAGRPGESTNRLIVCRQVFENLIRIAKANNLRAGGSLADIERCMSALRHVELVIRRVKEVGAGSLGYLPSFETLTHPKFVPHDQGNWWLINSWANE